MQRTTWRNFVWAGLLTVGVGAAPVAWADPSPPAEAEQGAPTQVKIDVQVVSASKAPGEVPPGLERLQKRMASLQTQFASYRVLSQKSVLLGLKSEEIIQLPGNRTLEITPRKFEKSGKLRVHLHLTSDKQAKLVDTDYAIVPGGDIVVGGPQIEDGSTLVVYIRHGS